MQKSKAEVSCNDETNTKESEMKLSEIPKPKKTEKQPQYTDQELEKILDQMFKGIK